MATTELTEQSFAETIKEDGITFVDFWAGWCQPCMRFAPIYDEVSNENPDIRFGKVDTEAEQSLAGQVGITAIPTLMAFRDNILVYSNAGAMNKQQFTELVEAVKGLDMDEVRKSIAEQESSAE